jgi:hypothetical protein
MKPTMMTKNTPQPDRFCAANFWQVFCSLIIAFIFLPVVMSAQSSSSSDAVVTQIAGNQIYFEFTDHLTEKAAPSASDTIYVFRSSQFIGSLKVIGAFPPRMVTEFNDVIFSLTRGTSVTLKWNKAGITPEATDTDDTSISRPLTTPSILSQKTTRINSTIHDSPTFNGRIYSGFSVRHSVTYWSKVLSKNDQRLSSTPFVNASIRAQHLPGNWDAELQGRFSYYWQTNSTLRNTDRLYIYNFNARKKFTSTPLTLQLGRFYNRYDTDYSFWDGIRAEYNFKRWGGGVTAGFEPIRSSELLRTTVPKAGFYVYGEIEANDFEWFQQVSSSFLFPDSYSNHWYIGTEQRIEYQRVQFDGEIQIENNADKNSRKVSRLQGRLSIDMLEWLSTDVHYNQRTSYLMYSDPSEFLPVRKRWGVRTSAFFNRWYVSAGTDVNSGLSYESVSYNSHVRWRNSPLWNISWGLFGSYWYMDDGHTLYGGLNAQKQLSKMNISTGLSLYQTKQFDSTTISGRFQFQLSYPFSKTAHLNMRLLSSAGDLLIQNSISVTLWKSF